MKEVKKQERLDKVLSNSGFGSRTDVKQLVKSGVVTVNGNVVLRSDMHINLAYDRIAVDGENVDVQVHVYYVMNKPAGYVCSTKAGANPAVLELISEKDRRKRLGGELGIVGRLDIDTEGLLIFTTDGELNHKLTSPKHHLPKTYFVQLKNPVSETEQKSYAAEIAAGVHIPPEDHEPAAVCLGGELEWLSEDECRLTIYQGLYHEVKRIFIALGNKVEYLKRIRMNKLELDENLERGEYRELTSQEFSSLTDTLTNGVL